MRYMVLPFRRYFDFQGRSRRMEFWMFYLLNILISIVFSVLFLALFLGKLIELAREYGYRSYESYSSGAFGFEAGWTLNVPPAVLLDELGPLGMAMTIAIGLYSLLILIPSLAVSVRRLHDSNRTGWWIVLPSALYLLAALLVVVGVTTPGMGVLGTVVGGLVGLAALAAWLVLLVFMFLDGTRGFNRFGPDPKGPDVSRTFA